MQTPIIVALVTGAFGILVALIQSSRRENKTDHGIVAESLRQVHTAIHAVGHKVDGHIQWHGEGKTDGRAIRSDHD